MDKTKALLKKYVSVPARVLFAVALASFAVHMISLFSTRFADFWNLTVGMALRAATGTVTSIIPWSLAETLILFLPVIFTVIILLCIRRTNRGSVEGTRFIITLISVASLLYSMLVSTTIVAYRGTPVYEKLGLADEAVSVEELKTTAEYMINHMNRELDKINFPVYASTRMPYSLGELNRKLLDAYDTFADEHSFIPHVHTRFKQVALSDAVAYTHISGMYTYYTGEANLITVFPDYTLPFTAAHELAHQRGILPENEANFIAFLVCIGSNDPYIRYSGYLTMYEYLNSALYKADYQTFAKIYRSLDSRVTGELDAYNRFFEKYENSTASKISSTVNDTYLKLQGQSAGEASYGMVVDLAVAWVKKAAD